MKTLLKILLFVGYFSYSQHHSTMNVRVDMEQKVLQVSQTLVFYNQSDDALNSIILNDWNHSFSDKNSPLGKRFSDEFVRSFFLANEKDRGKTFDLIITNNSQNLNWSRPSEHIDLVEVYLKSPLPPNAKIELALSYSLKIPNDKFTNYGFNSANAMALKNWFLTPARYENHRFVQYSNLNIDDAANALSDIDINIELPSGFQINSDLIVSSTENNSYALSGKNRLETNIYIQKKSNFIVYKANGFDIETNLSDARVNEIQKAITIDKIVSYCNANLGQNPLPKLVISENDYNQNPFYGLNQLPAFLRPFPDDFIFELKFLKTYLNNYLKTTLNIDSRKDNWIIDGIQMYYLMKYMDDYYPNVRMTGNMANYKLIKGYNIVSMPFNEQFNYFYLLMARKNLDQAIGNSKDELIKFNEKIASKYRAGICFKYLAAYIGQEQLESSFLAFRDYAIQHPSDESKLIALLASKTPKNIDWFFETIVNTRNVIDYKFKNVSKTDDEIRFNIKNKAGTNVPVPIYGLKNNTIVFKEWIDIVKPDSLYIFKRFDADKMVINYNNEVPEFNRRNNWKSLHHFVLSNKPIKFNFLKDLENPKYNQILYLPSVSYNLYDGIITGIEFHNDAILERPFHFNINPSYSLKSNTISGAFAFSVNQFRRESNLYSIKYGFSGSTFHYAPDADYQKINPYIVMRFRENDYRDNHRRVLTFREVYVNRQKSDYVKNTFEGSYLIFNARYSNFKTEITKHFGYGTDVQFSPKFGKLITEVSYRRLFNDNRQVNLRWYGGVFLYNNSETNYFNFALDRPTDYLFDYNYIGRSENAGLFSQEYKTAEGGFKSKLTTPFANQWITTANASFNIWNWIEVYGDLGFVKNKNTPAHFVYDSGIRLNLVTDYFELYFPVYSNNGWEISQPKYNEKIRFVATINTTTLIGLFTRKWF